MSLLLCDPIHTRRVQSTFTRTVKQQFLNEEDKYQLILIYTFPAVGNLISFGGGFPLEVELENL